MPIISSRQTFFLKRIFPVLWGGILVVSVAAAGWSGAWKQDPLFFLGPVAMLAFGALLFRVLVWNLADEVRDGGSFLVVRRGSTETRIALSDVMNVSLSQFTNPRRLTLRLRTPGKSGDEIVFIPKAPPLQFNPFARNAIAESLVLRVDQARRGADR